MLFSLSLENWLALISVVYFLLLVASKFTAKTKHVKTTAFTIKSVLDSFLFAILISAALYLLDVIAFKASFTSVMAASLPLWLVLVYVILDELFWRGLVAKKLNLLLQIGLFALVTAVVFSNGNLNLFVNYFVSLVSISAASNIACKFAGSLGSVLTRVLFVLLSLINGDSHTVPIYLILLFAPIAISYSKNKNVRTTLGQLRLTSPVQSVFQILTQTALLIFATFLILLVLTFALNSIGANDSEKVTATVNQFSLVALIVAVSIGPIAEEVFFRGFLQQKFGVVLTAIAFGVLHFGYGSVTEIVGALSIGLLFGWWVKYKNSSLWPVIIAHIIYNSFAITVALSSTGLIAW